MAFTGTYKNEGDYRYVNSSGYILHFHYTFNPEVEKFGTLELKNNGKLLKLEHNVHPQKTGNKFIFVLFLDRDAPLGTLILDVENDEFDINLVSNKSITERESDDTNLYKHGEY